MRDYGKVAPTFWTGETGKVLRQKGERVQLVALYLVTCHSANMIGLYYLPLPTLCHETGIPLQGATKALQSLSEAHFAYYDEASEVVWVPEMAKWQIGDTLDPKDKRIKGVFKTLELFRKSRFYMDFHAKYRNAYRLPDPSPLQAPCKPLRSQEQEQKIEQEQEPLLADKPPAEEDQGDQTKATAKAVKPRRRDDLFDAVAEVTASDPKASGSHIAKVCRSLRDGEPPYTPDEVRSLPGILQPRGFTLPLSLGTIEKYIGWARAENCNGTGTHPGGGVGRASRLESPRGKYDGIGITGDEAVAPAPQPRGLFSAEEAAPGGGGAAGPPGGDPGGGLG